MTLEVDVVRLDADAVVSVRGPVDLATVSVLEEAIDSLSDTADLVVVDLSEVTFLDSSGLRVLAQRHRQMLRDDGESRLRLVVTSDPASRLLDLSGLRDFFSVHATRDEARRSR